MGFRLRGPWEMVCGTQGKYFNEPLEMEARRQEWVLGVALDQLWISSMISLYSNSKGMVEIPAFE